MTKPQRKYDLEERLINFALQTMGVSQNVQDTYNATNLANQLVRSGSSVALNYGEAQGAESRKDFIHKLRIVQKELRETQVCLKMLERGKLLNQNADCQDEIKECGELVAIITASITTSKRGLT
jgi:four helix bundle protein